MKIKSLYDAFVHELSDMYNAEKQLTKALPKMAEAATEPQLVRAFETHLRETEDQISLLDRVVEISDIELHREKCDAMEGLVTEGEEIIKNIEEGSIRDSMLIVAAQKVEHYEIAGYGSLVALAKKLGLSEAVGLLEQILSQEKATDVKLNELAESVVNDKALQEVPMPVKGSIESRAGV